MIDKFYFHSHESTGIHISEIHLLSLSKNVNGIKQLCKCYHGNHPSQECDITANSQ